MAPRSAAGYSRVMTNDIAYANADFIPGAAAYPDRWAADAREFREVEASIGRARLNAPYGPHERQALDLFHPAGRAQGLVVFVHGGYWLRFDRSYWSHLAKGATDRGWAVAMPSYVLAPEATIPEITGQIGAAIVAAAGYVAGPIVLTGHSAGGHLVARMAMEDAPLPTDVAARIERILPISPVADLTPLIDTKMREPLHLTPDIALAESPALNAKGLDAHVSVWVGAEERPAFLDQARWLAEAWEAPCKTAPGRHHFDVIDLLNDASGPLLKDLLP